MEELYKAFGEQLRDLRNKAAMTQEELAERIGVKRTSIANIERGGQSVSLVQVYALAKGLNLKPADLLPVISDEPVPVRESVLDHLMTQDNARLVMKMIEGSQDATNRGESSSLTRASRRKKGAD